MSSSFFLSVLFAIKLSTRGSTTPLTEAGRRGSIGMNEKYGTNDLSLYFLEPLLLNV